MTPSFYQRLLRGETELKILLEGGTMSGHLPSTFALANLSGREKLVGSANLRLRLNRVISNRAHNYFSLRKAIIGRVLPHFKSADWHSSRVIAMI